jgi:arylsulfatase A-like enzyme
MLRRVFVKSLLTAPAVINGRVLAPKSAYRTEHVILIVPEGLRKREYRGRTSQMPNLERLALEGFVFEEDHSEQVASHEAAFQELVQGRVFDAASIEDIPAVLQPRRPRLIVCRDHAFEIGHINYERYLSAVRRMDGALGTLFDWVKGHPYFSGKTAIVFRPEFGRDDVVNEFGQLHHSYGFYSTHRVASIFWGPDFNRGVEPKTVITSLDMAPTLTRLFGVDATRAHGPVIPGLIKSV